MSDMAKLRKMAEVAGKLAGLSEHQIPGLAELFRVSWLEGARAQQREDFDRCDVEAKRWERFLSDHPEYAEGSADHAEVLGHIRASEILTYSIRHSLADPDEEPEPPPPPTVDAKPQPKRGSGGPRKGKRRG